MQYIQKEQFLPLKRKFMIDNQTSVSYCITDKEFHAGNLEGRIRLR